MREDTRLSGNASYKECVRIPDCLVTPVTRITQQLVTACHESGCFGYDQQTHFDKSTSKSKLILYKCLELYIESMSNIIIPLKSSEKDEQNTPLKSPEKDEQKYTFEISTFQISRKR